MQSFLQAKSTLQQQMVQQLQMHATIMDQEALELVKQLEQAEEQVQRAWGEFRSNSIVLCRRVFVRVVFVLCQ